LAEPNRSSRAINEACKLAGTDSAGDGTAAITCWAALALASSTALVLTNKPSLDDVLPKARRQSIVADEAIDHLADFALVQSIDRKRADMRRPDPRRHELRPERHDQQHG
jgi:hypothetical protein